MIDKRDASEEHVAHLLMRAAASGVSGPRRRSFHSPHEAIAYLAECIEACVLQRLLQIDLSNAARVEMVVANGRMLQVVGGLATETGRPEQLTTPKKLGEDDLEALYTALVEQLGEHPTLIVTTRPIETPFVLESMGISAAALFGRASGALSEHSATEEDESAINLLEGTLLAAISFQGEVTLYDPATRVSDELVHYVQSKLAQASCRGSIPSGSILTLRPWMHTDVAVVLEASGAGECALILIAEAFEQASEVWDYAWAD